MVEIITVLAVAAVLLALVIPALLKATARSAKMSCTNQIKQVGLAFRNFAHDNDGSFPMGLSTNKGGSLEYLATGDVFRHFRAVSNELSTPKVLICPSDTRKAASSFVTLRDSNISYFVSLDALESLPQMWLSGDRNLTTNGVPVGSGLLVLTTNSAVGWTPAIHQNAGNVLLSDGSVQQVTSSRLNDQVVQWGMATNRLVIP